MCVLNHPLTFCLLICQAGRSFGANCAQTVSILPRASNYWGPKWLLPARAFQPLHRSHSLNAVKEEALRASGVQSTYICPHAHRGAQTYFTEMYACSRDLVSRMEQEANAAEAQKTHVTKITPCPQDRRQKNIQTKHPNKLRLWSARPATPINIPGGWGWVFLNSSHLLS